MKHINAASSMLKLLEQVLYVIIITGRGGEVEKEKITLSVIKADVGSYTGHSKVHPELLAMARTSLQEACEQGTLIDYYVAAVGDDLELIMTHQKGTDNSEIHQLAWDTFSRCADKAKELKLYGAGQDLLADAFAGNVRGMGPGVAELEFVERGSEPVVIFMADKTEPGAWNYPPLQDVCRSLQHRRPGH